MTLGVELGATKMSRLGPFSRRAVNSWLSGEHKPSRLAQMRLDALGIVVRGVGPAAPSRPGKGKRAARYRTNAKVPPRALAEERALLARLGTLR